MAKKIILLPDRGPGEIEQDGAHYAQDDHQQRAKQSIHERWVDPASGPETLTDRFLKSGDALAHIAIINVHRVNLGKTLQSRDRLARRLLGYT
jgi:hypothetical protein